MSIWRRRIHGTAYQIKATDRGAYIDEVAADISVVAASEVAKTAGTIGGGMTIADPDNVTHLAMGGTHVDLSDKLLDAAMTGVGVAVTGTMQATVDLADTRS